MRTWLVWFVMPVVWMTFGMSVVKFAERPVTIIVKAPVSPFDREAAVWADKPGMYWEGYKLYLPDSPMLTGWTVRCISVNTGSGVVEPNYSEGCAERPSKGMSQ